MKLKPNCGSEKAWVWSTLADFADNEAKEELLAIRFATAESKETFFNSMGVLNPSFVSVPRSCIRF